LNFLSGKLNACAFFENEIDGMNGLRHVSYEVITISARGIRGGRRGG
jgi:hypothetical protein